MEKKERKGRKKRVVQHFPWSRKRGRRGKKRKKGVLSSFL